MYVDRFPARHPLCTCPELTFSNMTNDWQAIRAQCRYAHPVLSAEDCREALDVFLEPYRTARVGGVW